MSNNNLKNATMAAVLTAVIVTPVFGLQLIRQGARTSMESHWSLVALADQLGVDIAAAVQAKMARNAAKYPADRFRGSARKYDDPPDAA